MTYSAQPSAEKSFLDLFGLEAFVMKTVFCNMTDEQRAKALHEEATHDGKLYVVIWVEKGDWEADGRYWDTMLRLKYQRVAG
jgi:hypothetical protein